MASKTDGKVMTCWRLFTSEYPRGGYIIGSQRASVIKGGGEKTRPSGEKHGRESGKPSKK